MPKTFNAYNNNKTNKYYNIRTNFSNQNILKKIDWYSINNLHFLKYLWFLSGQNSPLPINIYSAGNLEIILVRATSSQQLIDRSKKQLKEQKNWPYLQGGKSTSRKKIRHSCPIMSLLLYLWDIAYFEGAFFLPIFF